MAYTRDDFNLYDAWEDDEESASMEWAYAQAELEAMMMGGNGQ